VGQAEAATDQAAIAKEPPDLLRMRVGSDVEVLGLALEQEIADAAADQIGLEAGRGEAVKDLEGVRINALSGDGVLAARPDAWPGVLGVLGCQGEILESCVDFADDRSPCAPAPLS